MCHTSTARNLLLALLVLGSFLSIAYCEDDDGEDHEPETEPVTEPEPEPQTEAAPEPIPEPPEEETTAAAEAELDECHKPPNATKEMCCKDNLEIDDALMKCFMLHQKKMPKKNEQNPAILIKFFSCLIECVYKSKKYIGKGDSLNMKMVKADANKIHKNDEAQKEYMIAMFEHCERDAGNQWRSMKKNPAARAIFTGACKPFYMFVFICTMDYPMKVSCPYFKWKGKKDDAQKCLDMRSKCEETHG